MILVCQYKCDLRKFFMTPLRKKNQHFVYIFTVPYISPSSNLAMLLETWYVWSALCREWTLEHFSCPPQRDLWGAGNASTGQGDPAPMSQVQKGTSERHADWNQCTCFRRHREFQRTKLESNGRSFCVRASQLGGVAAAPQQQKQKEPWRSSLTTAQKLVWS